MSKVFEDEDTPISVIHDPLNPQTPYVILDVNGDMRAQFVKQEDADAFVTSVNEPEQEDIPEQEDAPEPEDEDPEDGLEAGSSDNNVAHGQEDHEQQEEDDMPRGVPNKKKTTKKSATKKRAVTAVKKTAKKFAKKVKAKAKKRRYLRD